MELIARILRQIGRLEIFISAGLLLLMVISICAQVAMRYGWNSPIRWVEEAGTASLIWITFLAGSLAYKEGIHIRIWTPFVNSKGKIGYVVSLISDVLIVICSIWIMLIAIPVIGVENKSLTTSFPIALPRGWVFSIPVLIGFGSITLTSIYYILNNLIIIFDLNIKISSRPLSNLIEDMLEK